MLEQFTVENFKGFEKLTLEGLGHINIFVGKNNTGKTSLLQAVALSSFDEECTIPLTLRLFLIFIGLQLFYPVREMKTEELGSIHFVEDLNKVVKCNFLKNNGHSIKNMDVHLKCHQAIEKFTASLEVFETKKSHPQKIRNFMEVLGASNSAQYSLDLTKLNTILLFNTQFPTLFFSSMQYSLLVMQKKEKLILETLKKIDSRLVDLMRAQGDQIACDLGLSQRIPLASVGEGFVKIFAFACFLQLESSLVLIDEPENGLHYSAQKQFWGMLSDACLHNGKQSFIATHSYELLESLNTLLNENPNLTKPTKEGGQGLKVRVYKLERVEEKLQVVKITSSVLDALIKHGSEMRG
jgi:predicted ATP-dependent endonuclease of OLD family